MRVPFNINLPGSVRRVDTKAGTDVSTNQTDAYHCDEAVSGIRRKKPIGWMEPTAYSFTRVNWQRAMGVITFLNASEASTRSGCVGGGTSPGFNSANMWNSAYTFTYPTSVSTTALIKARNALQGGKVNYGQAIAEHNQTARLVGDSCKRLLTAIRAVRRGDARGVSKALSLSKKPPRKFVKKVQRTLSAHRIQKIRKRESRREALRQDKNIRNMKNVTGAWLELQYGWRPLLSDVQGSIENLQQFSRFAWIYTAKGSALQNVHIPKGSELSYRAKYAAGYCEVKGQHRAKYILIGVPDQSPASIGADTGLVNLPLLGWELIPFSFVVDWFLPVGNWLDSMDATLGYDSLRTVHVQFSKITWTEVGTMSSPYQTGVTSSSFSGFKNHIRHVRTVTSGVPLAGRPSIKDPRSFTHMANSLALLVQIFGSKSPIKVK